MTNHYQQSFLKCFLYLTLFIACSAQLVFARPGPRVSSDEAAVLAFNAIKETESGVAVVNRKYKANFDKQGMHFERRTPVVDWVWSFEGVYLENKGERTRVETFSNAEPNREGKLAIVYDRGVLKEKYRVLSKAIEQEFIIPKSLGTGDLLIRGLVKSNGDFSQGGEQSQWQVADAAITFGKLHVYDAAGIVIPASMSVKADAIELRVTAKDLQQVQYPLVIDPEIGTNDFRISDMGPDGDTNFGGSDPLVAYNVTNNQYLVVWRGDDDTGALVDGEDEIFGQRIDASTGAELGSDFRISDMGPDGDTNFIAQYPAVAYNVTNNQYLVVWQGDDNTAPLVDDEQEIFGQRIDASTGAEIGTDFRISDMGPDGDTNFSASIPSVAYNVTNNQYLVVWSGDDDTAPLVDNEREIFGQRIDASTGAELGTDFRLSDMGPDGSTLFGGGEPTVAYNMTNNQYLVVWHGDDDTGALVDNEIEIYGQRIEGSTGAEIGTDFRLSDMGPDGSTLFSAVRPSVAYNATNNQYLVVWHGDDDTGALVDGEEEIFGQRIDASAGTEIGTDFRISNAGPDGDVGYFAHDCSLAYDVTNNQYIVVWTGDDDTAPLVDGEQEIFGQLVDASTGAEIETDFRISDMGPDGSTLFSGSVPAVAYGLTNNQYLVVWSGDDDTAPLVQNEGEIFGQLFGDIADLAISKSDSEDPVAAGSSLSYTLNVTNNGPDSALDLEVIDTLPAGVTFSSATGTDWSCSESSGTVTCTKDSLDANASSEISVVVSVNDDTTGAIENSAMVTSSTFDGDSDDNLATETTTVVTVDCNISVNKRCRRKIRKGSRCKFTTSITQDGAPLAGATYSLKVKKKKKQGGGFGDLKKPKGGVSDAAGTHTLKLKIKKSATFRSEFSTPACETSEIKIKARKKKAK